MEVILRNLETLQVAIGEVHEQILYGRDKWIVPKDDFDGESKPFTDLQALKCKMTLPRTF